MPAEHPRRLARVAEEIVHLGRAEVAGVDPDEILSGFGIKAYLVGSGPLPNDATADLCKSKLNEFSD